MSTTNDPQDAVDVNGNVTEAIADVQFATAATGLLTVAVSKSEITEIIYSESAWHCAIRPKLLCLTPDHERTVMRQVGAGFSDMLNRLGGWVEASSFTSGNDQGCVTITFKPVVENTETLQNRLRNVVAELLAAYVLKAHYGESDSYFGTAWRKSQAQLMLIMARQEMRAGLP